MPSVIVPKSSLGFCSDFIGLYPRTAKNRPSLTCGYARNKGESPRCDVRPPLAPGAILWYALGGKRPRSAFRVTPAVGRESIGAAVTLTF